MGVTSTGPVRYRVLGPLEVVGADGELLDVRARKPRTLLCALLVSPGHTVSLDRIVEILWGDEPPGAATATLQAYVSQLRRLLEPGRGPRQAPDRLVTRPPGYALVVEPGALDAEELEHLVAQGEDAMAEGRYARAEDRFDAALALRRGTPFADVAEEPFALGAVARLDQLLAVADERRIDALLALGRLGAAVADLERRVAEQPHRERSWAQLVEALYRSDRQADALRAYQACRRTLADDLGVEPGPALRDLERRILAQEDLAPGAPPAAERGGTGAPPGALVGPPSSPGPEEGSGLVGRRAERDVVERAIAAAARGAGSIVVIEGESGIGKSRLAEEAVARAGAAGFATAWATCLDEVGAPPLWPWLDALSRLGGAVPPPVTDPDADPEAARFARVLAVLDALVATARERAVLLVVDDAQWADALSLRALAVLPGRLHGARLVVVATVRRPDVHDRPAVHDLLADLRRQRLVHRLHLDGLPPGDVAALAEEVAGEPVPAALAEAVAARTGGNPFFVSELVRLLVSERSLRVGGAAEAPLDQVPDSVREVVERRIGRLPDDTRTLLRLASISPGAIEAEVLERATGLSAERVIALLDVAVASGLLVEADDRFGWRFAHALVQDAVRATLGRAQRVRLHATLGDAVEALHGADLHRHLDELAHHRVEAAPLGRVEEAVHWSTEAAGAARAAGRHDLAVRHWEAARRLLEGSPADVDRRWDLTLRLAQDLRAAGHTHAFGAMLTEAIATASALHDEHRMALAAAELGWVNLWNTRPYGSIDRAVAREIERLAEREDDPALAARLRGAVAVELYYGDRAHGEALARRAVAAARTLDDPALLGRTLNNLVLAAWGPDRDDERLEACEESLALAGHGLPAQTEVVARLHRAALLLRRGAVGLVEADLARCRALVAEVALPEISAQLTYAECGLALLRARWDDAERLAEDAYEQHRRTQLWGADWCRLLQLVAIREAQGRIGEVAEWAVRTAEDPSLAPARATATMAVARAGDHAEARRLADRWDWRAEPVDWSWDHRLPDWAEAAALAGSPAAGPLREVLEPRADLQRVSGTIVCCRGSMHDVLARLAWATGDEAGARRHHDAAIEANRAVDATWWSERLARDLPVLVD